MELNSEFKGLVEDAVKLAERMGRTLDYTRESIRSVDDILLAYHHSLDKFDSDDDKDFLWDLAYTFGIYVGEVMMRSGLAEKGFTWDYDDKGDGIPVLNNSDDKNKIKASPVTKAHKCIMNGEDDIMETFADVIFSLANSGKMPKTGVQRAPDVETGSGKIIEKVALKEMDYFIDIVAKGEEDFMIFNSYDGFLQFYGIGDQFICEAWFTLEGRRAYQMINPGCANRERVRFVTPYGEHTPRERDIISREQLEFAVREYFSNLDEADFLEKVPHEDCE